MGSLVREVSWIHLSDLHVAKRGSCDSRFDRDQERCWNALVDDIAKFRENASAGKAVSAPDFIVLSGDVVKGGGDPDLFERAHELVARICAASDVPPERVFVIPGNHDIDRSMVATEEKLDMYKLGAGGLRQAVDHIWDSPLALSEIDAKFAAYREFAARYAPVDWGALSSWSSRLHVGDAVVDLIGLNSVWTGGSDELDRPGMPVIGRSQRELIDERAGEPSHLTLVLQHNPTFYLNLIDSLQHATWLDERDAIVFCGHVHRSELAERRSLRGRHLELTGGALYAGYEFSRRYSAGTIELQEDERKFAIALRASEPDNDFFARDLHRYEAARDGVAEFAQGLDTPNLGQRIARREQLEVEAERALLRYDDGEYYVRIEKDYRNPTDKPWTDVEARILVNAYPDDLERSRALYRQHPLELENIHFSARRDGEEVEFAILDDHDSSKDLLIILGDPSDPASGIQPGDVATVAYDFQINGRFWGPYFERSIKRMTQRIECELDFPEASLQDMSLICNPRTVGESLDDEIGVERSEGREIYRWVRDKPQFQSRYRFIWSFRN
jgi:predicted MPP superfamily phosphohydrolase